MGETVEFASNGTTGQGYLAVPQGGSGPGVLVIQEWWGLVDHIRDVCDRLADEGFVALAPDLYRGESTTEPDEAGKLMMAMNLDRASRDMSGAVDFLLDHDAVRGDKVGVTGFCMGGGLALKVACDRSDAIAACVPFYGVIPWENAAPDWDQLGGAVQGHYAERDDFAPPSVVRALEEDLRDRGKKVEMFVYPGTDHAFFNDTRPEVYSSQASQLAWGRAIAFLREELS